MPANSDVNVVSKKVSNGAIKINALRAEGSTDDSPKGLSADASGFIKINWSGLNIPGKGNVDTSGFIVDNAISPWELSGLGTSSGYVTTDGEKFAIEEAPSSGNVTDGSITPVKLSGLTSSSSGYVTTDGEKFSIVETPSVGGTLTSIGSVTHNFSITTNIGYTSKTFEYASDFTLPSSAIARARVVSRDNTALVVGTFATILPSNRFSLSLFWETSPALKNVNVIVETSFWSIS